MARHVTLVTGPPCSGKTTYVHRHAHPADTVLCLDELARAAGSARRHQHEPHHWDAAQVEYEQRLADLAHHDGTAWVVATAADPDERQHLADTCRADTVLVLLVDAGTCIARARQDRRHGHTHHVIRQWHERYQPRRGDEVLDHQPAALPTW